MTRYLILAILILIGANVGGLFYFNAKLDAKASEIARQVDKIKVLTEDNEELEAEKTALIKTVDLQLADFTHNLALFEEYKRKVADIKTVPTPSIKPIIKTVPADVVIVEANEISNEILNRINTSADNFSRMSDD